MDHLYTSKSMILWPISIKFFCKMPPIWGKLGAFLAKFPKIHPILQIGRIGYVTITHPSIYQNLRKCTSKPLSIPVYHLSVITPPGVCMLSVNHRNITIMAPYVSLCLKSYILKTNQWKLGLFIFFFFFFFF